MIEFLIKYSPILFSCFITIFWYSIARYVYNLKNKNVLLHPMLSATVALITTVLLFDIEFSNYQQGTQPLTWMIGPVSIGLMVPLFENFKAIKRTAPALLFTLIVGSIFTVFSTVLIAYLLGVSKATLLSLATKSVTTPVALAIGEQTGALPSLSSLIVIVTGVMGVMTAPFIFKRLNIQNTQAQGITLGLSAHIIGSAYAIEATDKSKTQNTTGIDSCNTESGELAAFSIVSMSIVALISSFVLPWLIMLLLK